MGELLDMAATTPHVIQNYLDPAHPDPVVELCREEAIFYQAYSSLRGFTTASPGSEYQGAVTVVRKVADKVKKTPPQVVLRWLVQQGIGIVPRSSSMEHIRANIDLFSWELSEADLQTLNKALGMDQGEEDSGHSSITDEL